MLPSKRKKALEADRVQALVEGHIRLEAVAALGEVDIIAYVVKARLH